MTDSVTRFSSRVENYAKYRPTYPSAVIDILKSDCALTPDSIIADVGSGTGILSELFLKNGNRVLGIEPNAPMRLHAERTLLQFPKFVSIEGTAEATTLEPASIDFVTAGQAFHWFNQSKAKNEFARVLKPGGWVVLIWNERRVDSTPFLRDYAKVRHEIAQGDIADFYAPASFTLRSVENLQHFDFESLKGRTRSASYTPEPGDATFEPFFSKLEEVFQAHEMNGKVTVEYDTRVYYGRL